MPVAYGPRSKWLANSERTDDEEMFEMLLPRMSYEIVAMTYDSNSKITNKQFMRADPYNPKIPGKIKAPVPYTLDFSVYIQTKNLNDGWQIIEQILPFFTPAYTVRVRHFPVSVVGDSEFIYENEYDMPITLTAVTWADDYAGELINKRKVEWTLEFQTKIHLFGPARSALSGFSKVIYDARAVIAGSSDPNVSVHDMDRNSKQYGGEAGWISSDSERVHFTDDSLLSPYTINKLMDSDGYQVRVIREFEV